MPVHRATSSDYAGHTRREPALSDRLSSLTHARENKALQSPLKRVKLRWRKATTSQWLRCHEYAHYESLFHAPLSFT